MEIGLDTYSYHLAFGKHPDRRANGPMTLAKCLNKARTLNAMTVQVDPLHFDSERDNPKWVKRMADSLNVKLQAGSSGIEKDRLMRDLEIAAAWEAKILRTFLGWELPPDYRHSDSRLKQAAEQLRPIAEEAEGLGITIAIENHMDIATPDLLKLIALIDSPAVGACLDVGNSMVCLENPVETAQQLAPVAVTCNMRDYRWEPTPFGAKLVGTPLGKGMIDVEQILQILTDAPKLQSIVLSCSSEAVGTNTQMLANEDETVRDSLSYLRMCM